MSLFVQRPIRTGLVAAVFAIVGLFAACVGLASASTLAPNVIWSGDFNNGTYANWSQKTGCPGTYSIVSTPNREGTHAVMMSVNDNDTMSFCPGAVFTPNPQTELLSPQLFHNGDDRYIGFSTYFPTGFPTITTWFQAAEVYGQPYGGSPPIGIDVIGQNIALYRDRTHNWDVPWQAPHTVGGWDDIVLHVHFSSSPSQGFVEIWHNGVQQRFKNGQTRLYYATLVQGINWTGGSGTNDLDLDQYRSAQSKFGTVTIYHDAAKVGTTYAAVAP